MIHLFCGYDQREAIGWHVFTQSVIARASVPVALIPLSEMGLPHGSNAFTLSRFLVPYLMDFKGHAIFCDACDMLMLGDVAELDALFDPQYAVQLVKHPAYSTKHKTKYRGTDMECPNMDYPRKNWASVMLINCEHPGWFGFRPDTLPDSALPLLQFQHFADGEIGEIPSEWNRLVDEDQQVLGGKVLHWTAGIPGFPLYKDALGADQWRAARAAMEFIA